MARKAADFGALTGLGNVATAFEVGGFVQYFPVDWFRARAELRQGFGGHHGIVADLAGDFIVPLWPQWTLSGGPRLTLESTDAVAPYSGLRAARLQRQGRPPFDRRRRAAALPDRSEMGGAFLRRIPASAGRRGRQPAGDAARLAEPGHRRHRRVLFVRHRRAIAPARRGPSDACDLGCADS